MLDPSMPSPTPDPQLVVDDWSVREVLQHEAALMQMLRRQRRHADELNDLRQDVYASMRPPASAACLQLWHRRDLVSAAIHRLNSPARDLD